METPPLADDDWHVTCQAIFQGVEGSEWETTHHNYKELHQQEGHDTLVFYRSESQRNRFLRSGQRAEESNKIPSEDGSLGNSPEESDGCHGRRAEAHGRWRRTGTVLCRRWKRNVSGASAEREWRLSRVCRSEFNARFLGEVLLRCRVAPE